MAARRETGRGGKTPTLPSLPTRTSKPHATHTSACTHYGHTTLLPDYKLLTIPRTNNYYAAVGGCPCVPRVAARPGSWRMRAAQLRSSTNAYTTPHHTSHGETCQGCAHANRDAFGWRPGPHTVHARNTAATGKCDTYGNMAFKSRRCMTRGDADDDSDAGTEKLEELEKLILDEHAARVQLEGDVAVLRAIQTDGTADAYKREDELQQRQRRIAAASEQDLDELLRDVRGIVDRPLHQVNMDLLRRIIARQEQLQRKREYLAAREKPLEDTTVAH